MVSFSYPPSLSLSSLHLHLFSLPHLSLSPLRSKTYPSPSPSLPPLSVSPSPFPFSLPFNHRHHRKNPNHQPPPPPPQFEDSDDAPIGDCLVFEDDAFENPTPTPATSSSSPSAALPPKPESLVPEKWKEVVEEMKLTKKEKRKISHQLRFGSKMEGRKKTATPGVEEYEAFKELKLSQLKPVVLDDPKEWGSLKEEEEEEGMKVAAAAAAEGRVMPRNPRVGLGEGKMEDIADFFNSGRYVPGEKISDDKRSQGELI